MEAPASQGRETNRYVTDAKDGWTPLRNGVTFEVLPDERDHVRMSSTDQEILARGEFLARVTGHSVTLMTRDSGARINARARGIQVFKLGSGDLLPRHQTPTTQQT